MSNDETVSIPVSIIEDIHYHLARYNETRTRSSAAHHFIELFNRVNDLSTWHPGYDMNTGTMSWEREDEA